MNEYVGSIHIHSTYSDGSKPIKEIIALAQNAELDFIIMSDHYTLQPLRDGLEGWHNDLLVLIGYEIADKDDNNHFLIFNLDEEIAKGRIPTKDYTNLVKEKGGYGFIAHPDEIRTHPKHRPYPWKEWDIENFTGIEIWNYMSVWMEKLTKYNGLFNFLFSDLVVDKAPAKTLERLDKLNRNRLVPAIGGIDAHENHYKVAKFFTVKIFPYKKLFRRIRTHILSTEKLTKNLDKDKQNVYNCIAKGSTFISNYYRGDGRGFRFYMQSANRTYQMGSRINKRETPLEAVIKSPLTCEMRLLKDGKIIAKNNGKEYAQKIDNSGVYRVETYRKNGAWIYSNPITVL